MISILKNSLEKLLEDLKNRMLPYNILLEKGFMEVEELFRKSADDYRLDNDYAIFDPFINAYTKYKLLLKRLVQEPYIKLSNNQDDLINFIDIYKNKMLDFSNNPYWVRRHDLSEIRRRDSLATNIPIIYKKRDTKNDKSRESIPKQ